MSIIKEKANIIPSWHITLYCTVGMIRAYISNTKQCPHNAQYTCYKLCSIGWILHNMCNCCTIHVARFGGGSQLYMPPPPLSPTCYLPPLARPPPRPARYCYKSLPEIRTDHFSAWESELTKQMSLFCACLSDEPATLRVALSCSNTIRYNNVIGRRGQNFVVFIACCLWRLYQESQ